MRNITSLPTSKGVSYNDYFRFSEILLDKMSTMMGIPQAKTVENCTCPEEYTSSSCQDPNKGFYRHFPNESESKYNFVDRILGVAKRCQCNSRSNDCERETGHCLVIPFSKIHYISNVNLSELSEFYNRTSVRFVCGRLLQGLFKQLLALLMSFRTTEFCPQLYCFWTTKQAV